MRRIFIQILFLLTVYTGCFAAQNRCFTKEEAAKVIEKIEAQTAVLTEDKDIRKELLKLVEAREKLNRKILDNTKRDPKLIAEFNQLGETDLLRVCQIIKEKGWLTRQALQDDGFRSLIYLIANNRAFRLQTEFYPILVSAMKKGGLPKRDLATIFDGIRVGTGQPQFFGTQASIRGEVVYIQPLLNEDKVDEWRRDYDLPPMKTFIRQLEGRFMMPVLKQQLPPRLQSAINKGAAQNSEVSTLGLKNEEDEVLKIDTKLVNLNVRIFNKDYKTPDNLKFTKDDFSVFEDGDEQAVSFFSASEAPFDLVLLLDFSGSTAEIRDVVRQAAQRFVEVARPIDRVAVVIFTNQIEVISDLTTERSALIEKIKKMDSTTGGSRVWGAVKDVYNEIIKKQSAGRRSAIVLMTDAEDNSIDINYTDLFEMVRKNDSTMFPVYLDTGKPRNEFGQKIVRKSQMALTMLAEESGGTAYYARNAKDLRGIYEQIALELGTVFSIGYEPKNENLDGSWRNLAVKIKTHPELTAKTRKGYYAK